MTLPDLDELIAEVDRTCANAYRPDDSQPDWLALLRTGTGLAEHLRLLGLSPEDLRHDLEPRLTTGASQAAERIAWTPYARRALSTARDLAHAEGATGIGCDHLLAGLTAVGRGVSSTVLGELPIDAGTLLRSRA